MVPKEILEVASIDKTRRSRNLWVILISNIFFGFGFSVFNIVYQPYIFQVTGSEIAMSLIVSIAFLMQFLPMPFAGKLSDKFGRKLFILTGLVIMAIGLLTLSYFNGMIAIIFGLLFFFGGLGINDPSINVFINENSDEGQKGTKIGFIFFAQFGGRIAGSILINILGEGYTAVFYFKIFALCIAIQWLFQLMKLKELTRTVKIKSETVQNQIKVEDDRWGLWKTFIKTRELRIFIIFFAVHSSIWGLSNGIFNGGLVAQYGITNSQLALILLAFNASNMIFQIPCGKLVDRIGNRKSIIIVEGIGTVFWIVNIIAWFLSEEILFIFLVAGQVLLGFMMALWGPAFVLIYSNLDKKHPAEAYGISSLMMGLGFAITTLLSGFLIELIHYLIPFILTVFLLPLLIVFAQKMPKTNSF